MSRRTSSPAKGNHHARLAGRLSLAHHVLEHVLLHLLRLSRGLHHGRPGADLRRCRLVSRRLQPHRPVRRRAAHVGRRRRRSGARLDPHVHLHGRHPGTIGIGRATCWRPPSPDEMVPRRARRLGHGHGHHPGRADRRRRRRRDHAVGDRAAADAPGGLRQAARHRHHRVGRHARHPDPARHHAGGDGARCWRPRPAICSCGAIMPGFLLSGLYIVYIIGCRDPEAGHGAEAAAGFRAADPQPSSGTPCGAACSR